MWFRSSLWTTPLLGGAIPCPSALPRAQTTSARRSVVPKVASRQKAHCTPDRILHSIPKSMRWKHVMVKPWAKSVLKRVKMLLIRRLHIPTFTKCTLKLSEKFLANMLEWFIHKHSAHGYALAEIWTLPPLSRDLYSRGNKVNSLLHFKPWNIFCSGSPWDDNLMPDPFKLLPMGCCQRENMRISVFCQNVSLNCCISSAGSEQNLYCHDLSKCSKMFSMDSLTKLAAFPRMLRLKSPDKISLSVTKILWC